MESVIIEVRSGEGGDDAKLLVREQMSLYAKFCQRRCL